MASAVRRLGSLSMARGCARIDAGPDTAKIGSADRVQVHHARLIAVIGVRKTFPHGLDPQRTFGLSGSEFLGLWSDCGQWDSACPKEPYFWLHCRLACGAYCRRFPLRGLVA